MLKDERKLHFFLLLATRKSNLHIVQTIKWYKVKKKKTTVTGKMSFFSVYRNTDEEAHYW